MAKKPQTDWEKAARALCRHAGNPENTMLNGRPMWMSYLAEAKAVLVAIGMMDSDSRSAVKSYGGKLK